MSKYSDIMIRALQQNREKIDTIKAFEGIIITAYDLTKIYEAEEGIDSISVGYPIHGDDYLMITIYLTEKGKISKDMGCFVDDFVSKTNCEYVGDIHTDATKMTKQWNFVLKTKCYRYFDEIKNPRISIKVDASKSKECKRVPTGEMIPVYEFICAEE